MNIKSWYTLSNENSISLYHLLAKFSARLKLSKMVTFALLVLGLAAAVSSPVTNEEWATFKKTYGKSYASPQEENYRQTVFEQKQQFIEEHNQRFLQGIETYDVRMNEFGDLTDEEVTSTMTGLILPESDEAPIFTYNSADPVNDTVDWRETGAVPAVKNQGPCGSCYAFSAIGSLEPQHFLKTGEMVLLSEQNAIDCVNTHSASNGGCHGGVINGVFKYIERNNGIDTQQSYPYEHKNAPCRFNASNVGATISSHVNIPKKDELALQAAVYEIGPISVALHAGDGGFGHYHSGVFNYPNCSKAANHGMVVIGYGTEEVGGDYWLVRNSWGHKWGDQGYIKMSRNKDNQCGIANHPSFPVV